MDPLTYIQNKVVSALEKRKSGNLELSVIAQNLIPSVFQVLIHDHEDTLRATKESVATLSDAEAFEHPQIKRILEASIEKVCNIYAQEYVDVSNAVSANNIITSDLEVLLKSAPTSWNRIKEKTYQEVMNDATPGSNDERVFLWVEEIKKGTSITPVINETIENYSTRAIVSFLKSQSSI